MSQQEQVLEASQFKEKRRIGYYLRHLGEVGLIDLLLGLYIRRSFTKAGTVLVTPGWPLPEIVNRGGNIEAGYCRLFPGVRIECWKGAVVKIGRGTYLNRNTEIVASRAVSIGTDCKVARDVIIMDTDQHSVDGADLITKPVEIGDRVWIGSRVIVLKGVAIGHDSVIGAGAVITRSVPPYSVVVGPAARVIKNLRQEE